MKVVNKIKRCLVGIGLFLIAIPNWVYGLSNFPPQVEYGVPREPTRGEQIWNIFKIFIIPFALLIGFIVYLKKSKSSAKRKMTTVLIVLAIIVIIYLIGNGIIENRNYL